MLKFSAIAICMLGVSPAIAGEVFDLALPIMQFMPMQQADGSRTWRFVINPRKADEETILSLLASEMGKAQWCGEGWEIQSRQTVSGGIIYEGRCKTAQ
jgi:hypothetical protein